MKISIPLIEKGVDMRTKVLIVAAILIPALSFGDWEIEVPYSDSSGTSASIGLDSNNNPHILYFVDDDHFYHIYKSGGIWYGPYPIEVVNYFTYCRMIDLAMVRDTAHALMSMEYTATGDYLLWGKHLGGGVWSIQQVPNTLVSSSSGGYINVAITPGVDSSLFHIIYVYYNYGSPILYYRKYTGTWTSAEEVTPIPNVSAGWQNDIAIDANDDPHICFVYSDEGVKYRKKSGDVWESVELVSNTTDPTFTSIVVDGSNYPHVAYDKDDFGAVCYRFKNLSDWQPEENVGTGGGWNTYGSSIVIAVGEKFVAYYGSGDLKFAMRTTTDWISEDVDTVGDVGTYASLVIDGEGYAHIAYRDATNDRLKYARSIEPVVGIKEVEQISNINARVSLLQVHPNPFRKLTTISFGIEHSAKSIELKIYDISGRLVRNLNCTMPHAPCTMQIIWDGTDEAHRPLPSGVYFLRSVVSRAGGTGEYIAQEKLLFLR